MPIDHEDQSHDEHAAFSRTGMVAPMGTLIDELKTKVDPETGAAFRRKVYDAGYKEYAGALRDWIYLVAHGKTYSDICVDASKNKREALFGTGPFEGLTVRDEVKS